MIRIALDLIAPDHCYSCNKIGVVLCESCKYDIVSERFGQCMLCLAPTTVDNLCVSCVGPLKKAWVVGARADTLLKLTDDSKFVSNRRACRAQAALLDKLLPEIPSDTLVVPLPTIWPHIRQRGFGHTELIAKEFSNLRDLKCSTSLSRATNSVQHGASRQQRLKQARKAYQCDTSLNKDTVLLIDDVCTTGASLVAAASVLRKAGASQVWVAVTTRQLVDDN